VQLEQRTPDLIHATVSEAVPDWQWLRAYLRLDTDHAGMLASFPNDEPLRAAVAHCRGLRLLRQEPWECLASFILSSTKQIVQIQQCVELLCERFGDTIPCGGVSSEHRTLISNGGTLTSCRYEQKFTFPAATRVAAATEAELRACKMGFRAKYLFAAANMVARGELNLTALPTLPLAAARTELMRCPGVGRKIADCVLLFSCGHDEAFPIDVWVERALQQLYFPKRRARRARLEHFAATHFGPYAGLAQQYLFHYLRTKARSHSDQHAR
jgi:N-glycosylase/DNA lyase